MHFHHSRSGFLTAGRSPGITYFSLQQKAVIALSNSLLCIFIYLRTSEVISKVHQCKDQTFLHSTSNLKTSKSSLFIYLFIFSLWVEKMLKTNPLANLLVGWDSCQVNIYVQVWKMGCIMEVLKYSEEIWNFLMAYSLRSILLLLKSVVKLPSNSWGNRNRPLH